ncbi:PREDICTED: AAA-ATPase ASD, mitochondrial [Nelumbo nucifera]|uniref:AAA+ ATPase domain-containing protein n=2 Tax=Nelumbo nucifera TaxID=4432 RepID=A0A822YJK6_NELNU|nr:PREDICTED: AAA-ATPase ASD, mitochondrial [Nelumbo nucifera]DAD31116.1 TPA_asm: hypothetical protein HUJ06_009967 [Nelumbo nucifera]
MTPGEMWAGFGSAMAGILFLTFQQHFPHQLRTFIERYYHRFLNFLYPYVRITFHEYNGDSFKRSEVFTTIQSYLISNCSKGAKRLKADVGKEDKNIVLSMDDNEEITDDFHGVKLWWSSNKIVPKTQYISFYPASDDRRSYTLTFHKRHRELINGSYLKYVIDQGKVIAVQNRQRKLFTNNPSSNWHGYRSKVWSHVVFEHPATFQTLAMDPDKKQEIIDDLSTFRKGKEYYAKIGKAWKRGYLLYGPPGTGKSTMIAAMANHLDYDVYDVELTTLKNNTELRKLLIETSSRSIIVIEDIDCSLDLTGQRKKEKKEEEEDKEAHPVKAARDQAKDEGSKVTLSGLLNFIDGLWSACGSERLVVFTTNHIEKLDPALIRRGRMDKHIELSYCTFEAFKVLAKNYLNLDSHELFEKIGRLMEETKITPADVAENLMPKTLNGNAESCLENLIKALETAKEEAILKAEEEAKEKAEALAKGDGSSTSKEGGKEDESSTKTEQKKTESSCLDNLIKVLETAKEEASKLKAEEKGKEKAEEDGKRKENAPAPAPASASASKQGEEGESSPKTEQKETQ